MTSEASHQSAPDTAPVRSTPWRGRNAVDLTNGVVQATLLPGGGALAAWHFVDGQGPQHNVLWESPWTTHDPGTRSDESLQETYGELGAARFLDSYTGHALCLDGFGASSESEVASGGALHGEASIATWAIEQSNERSVVASANLPMSRLRIERHLSLLLGESVLRCDERVLNLSDTSRPLHWVQHATIGSPLFSSTTSRVTASVCDGLTWPLDYEGCDLLKRDAAFTWPFAPGASGETVDLRKLFTHRGTGFVAATRQQSGRRHGFVAACNPETGLAMGYLYSAELFPWLTLWEENRARESFPWNGSVQTRGLEFGTTPFPLGNDAVDAHGPVLGTKTSLSIQPHQTIRAPWLLFLARIPETCRQIDDIRVEANEIVLMHDTQQIRLRAAGAAASLDSEAA